MSARRLPFPRLADPAHRPARLPAIAVALGALLAAPASAQPAPFSGAQCSMTNCDCTCIAGEQRKGAEALERLTVRIPSSILRSPQPMSPEQALSLLRKLRVNLDRAQQLLGLYSLDPLTAAAKADDWKHLDVIFDNLGLAPMPAGGEMGAYLESLSRQVEGELSRVTDRAATAAEVAKEIQACRQWADHKKCDPSLGEQKPAPPREQAPPPTVTTPPREMWPPAQPQPFGRHPDGRPFVDDELLTRYIAAKRAKDLEGGAYWRQGGFGQADFAEVEKRVYDWVRSQGTQGRLELFDQAELDAFQHREKEVREAYTGSW